jgi:hypothetical protein
MEAMSIMACTCNSDSFGDCFSNTTFIPSTLGTICPTQQSVTSFSEGMITTFPDSLSGSSCTSIQLLVIFLRLTSKCVQLAIVSALNFKHNVQVVLASNFATRNTVPLFPVHNQHGAVIGNLIGNGLLITVDQQLQSYQLCIPSNNTMQQDAEKSFTVLGVLISNPIGAYFSYIWL